MVSGKLPCQPGLDAELIVDGRLVTRGVGGWAKHFQAIQADGGEVEIVVPFKEVFRVENKVYTYHLIRANRAGVAMRMLAAGHAIGEPAALFPRKDKPAT